MIKSKTPLEKELERKIRSHAISRGWWFVKFTSPSLRGVPDRLAIRNGKVIFIETKRAGLDAERQQVYRHNEMRSYGAEVHLVDNMEQAIEILR